jgi:hypothetical protein
MSKISRKYLWIYVFAVILVITAMSYYFYQNFNRMITDAIKRSFNSNVISDVYDLNFEQLNINIITGDLKISNVVIQPKNMPLQSYPYINSSFTLKTRWIHLSHVGLYALWKLNRLQMSMIEIEKPEISLRLKGRNPIIFPFKEADKSSETDIKKLKKYLDSYFLKELILTGASLAMEDESEGKSYDIGALNITVSDLRINQQTGVDSLSFRKADLSLNDFITHSKKGGIKLAISKSYELNIDSFKIQQRPDTVDYQVSDFKTRIKDWQIVTSDSIYAIEAKSVELSYLDKAIHVNEFNVKPLISREAFSQRNKFQKELYSVAIKKMDLLNISFDRLKISQKLFIGQVNLQNADVIIYRDKTKAIDLNRFPEFPGQQIDKIGIPLTISDINISESALEYQEKKTDGEMASVKVGRINLSVKNFSNQMPNAHLSVKSYGFLENKVPFELSMQFSYKNPELTFKGSFKSFELKDLNPVIESYAPTSVKKGIVDEIAFSGKGYQERAQGEMKFLYHDLDLTYDLQKFSKIKNSLITFAAKNYLNSSNPVSPEKPARLVKFSVKRDRNKGFMNLIVKSVVSGLKETILPSKENRKTYQDSKRAVRKEQKQEKKALSR